MPTGETDEIELFVTKIDKGYSVVLSYDRLLQHKPAINWVETKVIFRTPSETQKVKLPTTVKTPPTVINICKVSVKEFCKLSQEVGATMYMVSNPESTPYSGYSIKPIDLRAVELKSDTLAFLPEYQEFANVFSGEKANTLVPHRPYDLQINVEEDAKPSYRPIYSLSPPALLALHEFLDENTQNGFIRPSSSPWGSPVLFIKKKDGSLQLCVDYRALNKVTCKDRYPLPLICDLLDSPGPTRIYTNIDLKHTYHLVWIADWDDSKMAFRTCYGSFKWMVMPFRLSNVPAAFQCFINEVLGDLHDVCTIRYLDDILIYSDSLDNHCLHMSEILCCLQEAGLYANLKKCIFHTDTVEYLGFILSPEGLRMDPSKVDAIQSWLEPGNVHDVQSFLGFTNFYR